jgi:hypothetical protein
VKLVFEEFGIIIYFVPPDYINSHSCYILELPTDSINQKEEEGKWGD